MYLKELCHYFIISFCVSFACHSLASSGLLQAPAAINRNGYFDWMDVDVLAGKCLEE